MESPRLPRFKRTTTVAPIQLRQRDREIIRLVHQHRFLRSTHVTALVAGSSAHLLRRLQLLYHHGYLERPRAQLTYYQPGSRHIVYGLGNKGGALLKQDLGAAFRKISWSEKNRSVGRVFLAHTLLVSDVMVAIELACRTSDRVWLISQEELKGPDKPLPFRWRVQVNPRLKLGVVPDQVFALEYADQQGKSQRSYFFLEADRGTMPIKRRSLSQTSFYRKLLAYEATWTQSLHHTRFGFHRFRVLTVTTTAARVESLVNACTKMKRGHGLFLFADRTILENPADLLSATWRTSKRGETGCLLD